MREIFKDVIHPEMVLGRRGQEVIINAYKEYLQEKYIVYTDQGWKSNLSQILGDITLVHHISICKKFKDERPNCYRLGRDFGEILAGISNDIPIDKLPDRFFGYISFPEGVLDDDTGTIYGAYVFIGDAKETPAVPSLWGKKTLWISIVGANPERKFDGDHTTQHILMELKGSFDETFKSLDMVDRVGASPFIIEESQVDSKTKLARLKAVRCIVNSVLYINSLEPNLDHLRPMNKSTNSEKRKVKGHINLCSVPLIAVNWSYKRDRTYSVNETYRMEHYRWQRCGPELSQVKLVLVRGHIVHYSKDKS